MRNYFRLVVVLALATSAWAAESAAPQKQIVFVAVLQNGFNVRHDHREKMGEITRLYLSADSKAGYVDVPTAEIISIEWEETLLPPPAPTPAPLTSGADLNVLVNSASDLHQVDPDLIRSVIKAESGFNVRAVSPKGAQGLMQLMPGTANELGVKDAFEPDQNIEGGTRYLRDLLVLYNNDMAKALAAYNAGPRRVEQYHGVPPYRETHTYVARVIKDFNRTKLAARKSGKTNGTKPATGTHIKRKPQSATAPQRQGNSKGAANP